MPDFTLTDAIAEAYASAPSNEPILDTLEIRHPDFTQPIRVVNDYQNFDAFLEADAPLNPGEEVTFISMRFEFIRPEISKSTSPEIEMALDNVSGDIAGYLDTACQSPDLIEVTYRPYLASDPTAPTMNPPMTLNVKSASASVFRVTARAGFGDFANLKFPSETYDDTRFEGLSA